MVFSFVNLKLQFQFSVPGRPDVLWKYPILNGHSDTGFLSNASENPICQQGRGHARGLGCLMSHVRIRAVAYYYPISVILTGDIAGHAGGVRSRE
ncbi:MAG: hypothetical protein B6245_14805, partial [Desulfobacteraceae bacterium 4572_88]